MEQKQTNLCLAADLADWNKLTELVKKVGHKICVLKTHLDIINNLPAAFDKYKAIQITLLQLNP